MATLVDLENLEPREGLRLVDERERRLDLLDDWLAESLADLDAGRHMPADEVFDRLTAKYDAMAKARDE